MDRRTMEGLEKIFCSTLDDIVESQRRSPADIEMAKNALSGLVKLDMYSGGGGYSQRGYSRDDGMSYRGNSYDGGNSYGHYTRGYYSRDGGYSNSGMMEHLDKMMEEAKDDRQREMIREFKSKLDR